MDYDEIVAGILRVEAQNDRSDWHAVPKPPLGKIRKPRKRRDDWYCSCEQGEGYGRASDGSLYCARCGKRI